VSQTITVSDTTAPTLEAPRDVTAECPNVPAVASPNATDNCDDAPPVVFVDGGRADRGCPGRYALYRGWKATDSCGNEATTATQVVNIQDTTPPFFTGACASALAAATIACPGDAGAPVPACAGSDACGSTALSFSCCSDGSKLTRTWTLTDQCGLTATRTQDVVFGGACLPPS
jgi:hypothetical protein